MNIVVLLLVLVSETLAQADKNCAPVATPCGSSQSSAIDAFIRNLTGQLPDPLRLPDRPRPSAVRVELSEGEAFGLSRMVRYGGATLTCDSCAVTLSARLRATDVQVRYEWKRQGVIREMSGVVLVVARTMDIDLQIRQERTLGARPSLQSFEIDRVSGVEVEMSGGYVPWFITQVSSALTPLLRNSIASRLEGPLREAFDREVTNMVLPVQ